MASATKKRAPPNGCNHRVPRIFRTATALMCFWQAAAGTLSMSVVLEKDTVLPYEPIFGEVVVTNTGEKPVVVPPLTRHYPPDYFDVTVTDDEGNARICEMRFAVRSFAPGISPSDTIAPGSTASSILFDIGEWMGDPDPDTHGFVRLPQGTYTVSVGWRKKLFPQGASSLDQKPAGSPSKFTVRPPIGRELDAMRAYAEALYFMWKKSPEGGPTSSAMKVRRDYSDIDAYAAPATGLLLQVAFGQFGRHPDSLRQAMADSVASLYRSVVEQYPETPTAKYWLRDEYILERMEATGAYDRFLHALAQRLPETRVGKEAKRILATRGSQR